ncbi:tandem-95 repeat protein, partial [bacterium]
MNEDATYSFTPMASDPDAGDTKNFSIAMPPSWATFNTTTGTLSGTPSNSDVGTYSNIVISVEDSSHASASLPAFSITVKNVNDAPVATAQSVTTAEDTAKAITLAGTDVDSGTTLTYAIVAQPAHGTLTGTAPSVTYTPAANYNGADSFTFKVNDGAADSTAATVSITVTGANDAPVATAQSVTTAEDTAKAITLAGTDVDSGTTLTYAIVAQPAHGTLTGTAPSVTYTPAANYNGADSFTFKVNDGAADSTAATVSITVTGANDAPVLASIGAKNISENSLLSFTVSATDIDGDVLAYSATGLPSGANFDPATRTFTWTPSYSQAAAYTVNFTVSDGKLNDTEAVAITVSNTNRIPTVTADAITTAMGTPAEVLLSVTELDASDVITSSVKVSPSNGILVQNADGTFVYVPNAGFYGSDTFTITVSDGAGGFADAVVSVTVQKADSYLDLTSATPKTYNEVAYAGSVTVIDVTGDNIPDMVVADTSGNKIFVYKGLSDGTFAYNAQYPTNGTPDEILVADLDGDGDKDIVSMQGSSK